MKTAFVQRSLPQRLSQVRFVLLAFTLMVAAVQVFAQSSKPKKPEPLGYAWADKFLNEVYLLDVDVDTCTKQIDNARYYLAEMAEDPVVFVKEKATTDFNTVVKVSREKFEQGKAAKKTIDELFAGADFASKLKTLGEQLKQITDKKALAAIGKNLKEASKNLSAMPKTVEKLTNRVKSITAQGENAIKEADKLDMFKKGAVVPTLTSSISSLKSTGEKMPSLGDVSVKTLDLYKQVLANVK